MDEIEVRDEIDAYALGIYRTYFFGDDPVEGDWVEELFPDGLPEWATLELFETIAGNRMCRMVCIYCGGAASPVQPEDHRDGCTAYLLD